MATGAPFVPNLAGIAALEVALAPALLERAETGATYARALAAEHSVTGRFRDSIHAAMVDGVPSVVSDDPDAVSKEFGTEDTDGVLALTRAADYLQNG